VLPARICPQAGDWLDGGAHLLADWLLAASVKQLSLINMADLSSKLTGIPLPSIQVITGNLPWNELIKQAGRLVNLAWERLQKRGLYEVLEYESTLELLDTSGKRARFSKRQRVRYLQNNIIAYQDQAWGNGVILLNYRCSPGKPVDRYELGHKTLILISLREIKQRGDIDEFNIQWEMKNGFRQDQESWETEISHRTRNVKVQIIFPKERPPLRSIFVEASRQVSKPTLNENRRRLPDGRWKMTWDIDRSRWNEHYIVKWEW